MGNGLQPLGGNNLDPTQQQLLQRGAVRQADNARSQGVQKMSDSIVNDSKQKGGQSIQSFFKGFGGGG